MLLSFLWNWTSLVILFHSFISLQTYVIWNFRWSVLRSIWLDEL
jgi:hypothetical protein